MRILIISATETEIADIRIILQPLFILDKIDFAITGIGIMQTVYNLQNILYQNKYDFILQIGIAGSYDSRLPIGSLCQVSTEILGDLGSENSNGEMLDVFDLGFIVSDTYPFKNKALNNDFRVTISNVNAVVGSTVNKTSGNKNNISLFKSKYPYCQIESMEGAALFYVCIQLQIPFMELRAISNMVEERKKENWNIKLALKSITENIESIVINISDQFQ